ncbi:MAG: tripartite tricarboxylate transporter substrate binding protein [Burkholderiales bacterium]|nr:tripartite tricarboxylate transporter substrate binding protein [Burkholderiales bacterium]
MKPPYAKRALVLQAIFSAAAVLLGCNTAPLQAQDTFPNKPIRVMIPFPPGGAIDNFARTIGPELSAQLGQQPLVIINKPGGGSQIAAADILNSPADGHTLFVAQTGDFSVNPILYKNSNYLPTRDFDGVAMLLRAPLVMLANVAGKLNGVKSLRDTLATPGGSVFYGSFGPGTAPHLLGHILSRNSPGAKFTHIPYKGFPPAMQAIVTNEVDLLFDAVPGALNMMRTGRVVPLAVAAAQRNSFLPNVPTTAEIGLPYLLMDFWIGVAVKKGTPRHIVNRLHEALDKAVASPENLKKFTDIGYSRVTMPPEQFDGFIRAETEKMRPVIVDTGVSVD